MLLEEISWSCAEPSLPSLVLSQILLVLEISSGTHPPMTHGRVCNNFAMLAFLSEDLGILFDYLSVFAIRCEDNMWNGNPFSIFLRKSAARSQYGLPVYKSRAPYLGCTWPETVKGVPSLLASAVILPPQQSPIDAQDLILG